MRRGAVQVRCVLAAASIVTAMAISGTPIAAQNPDENHFAADDYLNAAGSGGSQLKESKLPDSDKPSVHRKLSAEELERQRKLAEERAAIRGRLCNGYTARPDGLNLDQGGNPELCDPTAPPPAIANTPEMLSEYLYVSIQGMLPTPEVESNPDPGVPSIINVPVFVEVTNWQAVFTDRACDRGLCVTVTATPQLTFDPGESGSSPVTCQGRGSRYDPNSDLDPNEQAVGACAYAYTKRTGTAGRPKTWPGQAIVTWTLNWTSTSGRGGSLPPVTLIADLPKSVVEVQALVTE